MAPVPGSPGQAGSPSRFPSRCASAQNKGNPGMPRSRDGSAGLRRATACSARLPAHPDKPGARAPAARDTPAETPRPLGTRRQARYRYATVVEQRLAGSDSERMPRRAVYRPMATIYDGAMGLSQPEGFQRLHAGRRRFNWQGFPP